MKCSACLKGICIFSFINHSKKQQVAEECLGNAIFLYFHACRPLFSASLQPVKARGLKSQHHVAAHSGSLSKALQVQMIHRKGAVICDMIKTA